METATGDWGGVLLGTSSEQHFLVFLWGSKGPDNTESVSVNESHVTESCEGWIDNDLTELKHKNRSTREYQVTGDSRMEDV